MNNLKLMANERLNTPLGIVLMVAATLALTELGIMLLFATPFVSNRISADILEILDPLMLITIEAPALYFLVFRSLLNQQTDLKQKSVHLGIAATAFEVQEGIIVTDINNRILSVNRSFTRFTGYAADEVVGRTPSILQSGRQSKDFYLMMWDTLAREKYWEGEIWNRRKNGEVYPEWLTITAVVGHDGNVTNYVGAFSDISAQKKAEAEVYKLAFHDFLTGLPNRRLLTDRMQQVFAINERYDNHGAVLFLDLDNFKVLNDTRGHGIGDLMLVEVARRLQSCVRADDTVARMGGDEFVVMLANLDEDVERAGGQAKVVAQKILALFNRDFTLNGYECACSTSIGISLFCNHDATVDLVLKRADSAMYQAKAAGRNVMRFFDPVMQAMLEERAFIEAELSKALLHQQFRLYYQAQVDSSGRIWGAEALLRWLHPERGLVSPAEFIPLIEESGLILPVGNWVLETACAQLRKWGDGDHTRNLKLSINVSALQFHQHDFVAQVRNVLASSGIDPGKLKLELTESMTIDDVDSTVQKMLALKETGVCFSMDDFGTGQSSLTYLKRLPLDQIKIDQHFVRNVVGDQVDAIMVGTIICMANNLGLEVIAEGVETEEQMAFLVEHGCNAFQGYLFSKPVPLEEFEQLIPRRLTLGRIGPVHYGRKKVVSACTRCNNVSQRTMETALAS